MAGKICEGNLHYRGLFYISERIRTEPIGRHHNEDTLASRRLENLLPGNNFGRRSDATTKAMSRCGVCLSCSCYQYLPVHLNDLFMDYEAGWPISTDWKGTSYDLILVVIDRLIKIVTRLNCGY